MSKKKPMKIPKKVETKVIVYQLADNGEKIPIKEIDKLDIKLGCKGIDKNYNDNFVYKFEAKIPFKTQIKIKLQALWLRLKYHKKYECIGFDVETIKEDNQ